MAGLRSACSERGTASRQFKTSSTSWPRRRSRPGCGRSASKTLELIGKLGPGETVDILVVLLSGAAAIEALAGLAYVRGALVDESADAGFALSLVLFGSFFLIDDAFDDYDIGAKHRAILHARGRVAYGAVRACDREVRPGRRGRGRRGRGHRPRAPRRTRRRGFSRRHAAPSA